MSKPSVDSKAPEVLPEALFDLEIVGFITVSGQNLNLTTQRLFSKVFRLVYLDFPFLVSEWVNGKHVYLDQRIETDMAKIELEPAAEVDINAMLGGLSKKSAPAIKPEKDVCRSAFFNSENIMIDFIQMMQGKAQKTTLSKIDDWLKQNITNCEESSRITSYMWIIHRQYYWDYDGEEPTIKIIYNNTITSLDSQDVEVVRKAHKQFKLLHLDEENRQMINYFLNFWLKTKNKQPQDILNRKIFYVPSFSNKSVNFRLIRTDSLAKQYLITGNPKITCKGNTLRANYELASQFDITVEKKGNDMHMTISLDHYVESINFLQIQYQQMFRFLKDFVIINDPRLVEGNQEIHTVTLGSIFVEVKYHNSYLRHKEQIQLEDCKLQNKPKALIDEVIRIGYEQRCIKESRDQLKHLRMFQQKMDPLQMTSFNLFQFVFAIHPGYNVQKWINILTNKEFRPFDFTQNDRIEEKDHMKLTCRFNLLIRRFISKDMVSDFQQSIRKQQDEKMMFNEMDVENDVQIKQPPGYTYFMCSKEDIQTMIDKMEQVCGAKVYAPKKMKENSVEA